MTHRVAVEDSIDLHSFQPRDIPSVVDEYISMAIEAGFSRVRVIHGRGRGVQRAIVQRVLDGHPGVLEFWDDTAAHLGATIARLAPKTAPQTRS